MFGGIGIGGNVYISSVAVVLCVSHISFTLISLIFTKGDILIDYKM